MTSVAPIPRYFNCLDVVRMFAALAVVITHYHHFYLVDAAGRPDLPPTETFPYAAYLAFIYEYGGKAVEFFWIISGFVFTHVYLGAQASLGQFFMARVARLYPLHFVTLIFVLGLQLLSQHYAGHAQIYGNNDAKHFVLQLFMASNATTFSHGLSYNGPIWSVSLEIGAYFVFFFALFALRRAGLLAALAFSALFWAIFIVFGQDVPVINKGVFLCSGYFFAGVAAYFIFLKLSRRAALLWLAAGALAFGAAIFAMLGVSELALLGGFGAVILIIGWLDQSVGDAGAWLKPVGNISYSLYLVHVPLQMCLLLYADLFWDGSRDFAQTFMLLPVYLALSVLLAVLAFRYIERPAGRWIRGLGRRRAQA